MCTVERIQRKQYPDQLRQFFNLNFVWKGENKAQ